jgi:hemolysin activation/secretion protein
VVIVYAENYGSASSGRYRYGVQDTLNNLTGRGDKLSLGGLISNHDLRNYAINYETPTGPSGTMVGIGYSRMDYDLGGGLSALGATRQGGHVQHLRQDAALRDHGPQPVCQLRLQLPQAER